MSFNFTGLQNKERGKGQAARQEGNGNKTWRKNPTDTTDRAGRRSRDVRDYDVLADVEDGIVSDGLNPTYSGIDGSNEAI